MFWVLKRTVSLNIGIAPITQITYMLNKNSNIQGMLLIECDKSVFPYYMYKELLIKERIWSLWEPILSFNRSSFLKRDAIEENHCLIQ